MVSVMKLIKATKENGLFHELETQWRGQFSEYDEDFDDYQSSYREHTKQVLEGSYTNYHVYILENKGAYEAFAHVNHAQIKKLPGHTLRVTEVFLAPRYEYENTSEDTISILSSALYAETIRLSRDVYPSETSKLYMRGLNHTVLSAFARFFSGQFGLEVVQQGAWLVTTKISAS